VIQPDDFFAALADPTRRRILALLLEGGERCVCVLYSAAAEGVAAPRRAARRRDRRDTA